MAFIVYFLVGDRPLGIIVDLLCLIKLLLCLVDLYRFRFLSSFTLYLVITIGICFSCMLAQCIEQNLQLSCSIALIISYLTHFSTFVEVFLCVQVTGLENKYYKMMQSIPLVYFYLSINVCYVNSVIRVWVGLCNDFLSQDCQRGKLLGH